MGESVDDATILICFSLIYTRKKKNCCSVIFYYAKYVPSLFFGLFIL